MAKTIETDFRTFIKFWSVPLIIAGIILFLYKAMTGLIIIGISIFLALALKPLVRKVNELFIRWFGRNKKHETASVVLAYLIVVAIIGLILGIVGPVVVNETAKFIHNFPETFDKTIGGWEGVNNFGKTIGIENLQKEISTNLDNLSNTMLGFLGSNLVSSVSGVADVMMKVVLSLVLTLLFLLEGPEMMDVMWKSLKAGGNKKSVNVAKKVVSKMANVVSTFASRQVLVAILDGCATATIVFILSLILGFSPGLAIPMGMITICTMLQNMATGLKAIRWPIIR